MGWVFVDMKIKTDVIRLGKYLNPQPVSRLLESDFGLCDSPVACGCILLLPWSASRCSLPPFQGGSTLSRTAVGSGLGPNGWTMHSSCNQAKTRKFLLGCVCFESSADGGRGIALFHSHALPGCAWKHSPWITWLMFLQVPWALVTSPNVTL